MIACAASVPQRFHAYRVYSILSVTRAPTIIPRAILCSGDRLTPSRINQVFDAWRKLVEWRVRHVMNIFHILNPSSQGHYGRLEHGLPSPAWFVCRSIEEVWRCQGLSSPCELGDSQGITRRMFGRTQQPIRMIPEVPRAYSALLPVFLRFFPCFTALFWVVGAGGSGADVRIIFSRTQ